MLLTIPWVGGIILGRVDIINKQGVDGKCSKLKLSSLWKSVGVEYWWVWLLLPLGCQRYT